MNSALGTWNDKLAEIWALLTQDPATFKGGGIWGVMLNINGALKAIGLGLLVLFFAVGVVKTCSSLADVKRPEHALKLFIRLSLIHIYTGAYRDGTANCISTIYIPRILWELFFQ